MAKIVLVHGIDQQQKSAQSLEMEWIPNLAGGVQTAGFPAIADSIWQAQNTGGKIEIRMAFYGDLFLTKNQQGDGAAELDSEQTLLAEQIAVEWLQRAAVRTTSKKNRETGVRELSYLEGTVDSEPQGMRALARSAVNGAARLPWFAQAGMAFAERFVLRSLSQVTKYLTDETVRREAQSRVHALIGEDTKIIIGHSLGSVVAFEVAHQLSRSLPLLLTIGSPLGLETVIFQKLRPQPPAFPTRVQRWVNIADANDLVAAEPDLGKLFAKSVPLDACLEGCWTVDNGSKPHEANFYLTKREVGRPIAQTLAG